MAINIESKEELTYAIEMYKNRIAQICNYIVKRGNNLNGCDSHEIRDYVREIVYYIEELYKILDIFNIEANKKDLEEHDKGGISYRHTF